MQPLARLDWQISCTKQKKSAHVSTSYYPCHFPQVCFDEIEAGDVIFIENCIQLLSRNIIYFYG
jgi:hypothetical protein